MNEEKTSFMDQLFTEPVYSDSPQTEALFLKALQEELIFITNTTICIDSSVIAKVLTHMQN